MTKQDNHEANQTASLADLPLTEEQAKQAKAGGPFFAYDNNFRGGVSVASGN